MLKKLHVWLLVVPEAFKINENKIIKLLVHANLMKDKDHVQN